MSFLQNSPIFTGTATFSGSIYVGANGGVAFADGAPATTTNKLYNVGAILYWNGSPVIPTTSYATTVGDGTSTSIVVTHSLGTTDVGVSIFEVGGNKRRVDGGVEIRNTSTTQLTLVFSSAPATNSLRVVVFSSGGAGGGGGSSVTLGIWNPDVKPSSPSAYDDEFESSSLNAKWTKVNWDSASPAHTWDIDTTIPKSLYSKCDVAGSTIRAIMQSLPAGDFTILTKLKHIAYDGWAFSGFILSDGVTAGTGNQQTFCHFTQGYGIFSRAITNWNTDGSYTSITMVNDQNTVQFYTYYIRLRRTGGNYYLAISTDGLFWVPGQELTVSAASLAFTPTHFGLAVQKNAGASPNTSVIDFFRYSNSATTVFGGLV